MKFATTLVLGLAVCNAFSQNTTLSGKIINPTTDTCTLSMMIAEPNAFYFNLKELGKVPLNEDGTFSISFELDSSVSAIMRVCNESTDLLFDPGDEIHVVLNSQLFDETISYTGKGAEKNNQVAKMYLMNEDAVANIPDLTDINDTAELRSLVNNTFSNYQQVLEDHVSHELPGHTYARKQLAEIGMMIDYQIRNKVKSQRIKENNVGQILTFSGTDIMGKKVKSSSYKGKVTVLDFWASWCGPCKAEMPDLKKLEDEYGNDVNFVGVGVWDQIEDWKHASTKLELHNSIYIDKKALKQFESLELTSIPRYVVLDKDGKVIDPNAPRPSSGHLQKYF